MRKIFLIFALVVFTLTSCEKNELYQDVNDNIQYSEEFEVDSILFFNVDTTTNIFKSLKASTKQSRLKVSSSTTDYYDAMNTIFDLRGLPVNITVVENSNGNRILTAKRNKRKTWFKTTYSDAPAVFGLKTNDNDVTSQTFYLNYVPLVGYYYLTTNFGSTSFYMSIGSYSSSPNNKFLYARNGSYNYSDEFAINPTDEVGSSFFIQNSYWFGSDDINNPWSSWNYTLGCSGNNTFFDKYRNTGNQQFTITPLENFTLKSIEYKNDQTALLEKAPDFVVSWSANNATSVSQQMSTNFGSTASKTSTFSKTLGVSLKVSAGIKVGIPFIADGKISTEIGSSASATWGESETTQDTRNYNFQLIVPANRRVVATAAVSRYIMKLSYTAYLKGDVSGRTIRLNGSWSGVDCTEIITNFKEYDLLTNAYIKTTTIKGKPNEIIKL